MKKVISLIIILILFTGLTGCGSYNLSFFIIPNDTKFLETIGRLSTPSKISDYMIENFVYKANPFTAISPYTLWKTRVGDCTDFATFGAYIANYHGFTIYQLKIFYDNFKHQIAIYSENNFYSITTNQNYYCYFIDFIDIVNFDSIRRNATWSKYIVYDYDNNIIETGYNN